MGYSLDGQQNPPRGVRGGHDADPCAAWVETADGTRVDAPPAASLEVREGERIVSVTTGGGGYGDPLDREPARVLDDVLEQRVSRERARTVYGVVLSEDAVDETATLALRASLRADVPVAGA